jgi:hypothetical protein
MSSEGSTSGDVVDIASYCCSLECNEVPCLTRNLKQAHARAASSHSTISISSICNLSVQLCPSKVLQRVKSRQIYYYGCRCCAISAAVGFCATLLAASSPPVTIHHAFPRTSISSATPTPTTTDDMPSQSCSPQVPRLLRHTSSFNLYASRCIRPQALLAPQL